MSAVAMAAVGGANGAGELWGAALRAAIALLLFIPVVYGVTRLYGRRLAGAGGCRILRVVDAVVLGPNRAVYLIEVGDRLLVLGVTAQHISLLSEVSDPAAVAALKQRGTGGEGGFRRLLRNRMASRRAAREGEDER